MELRRHTTTSISSTTTPRGAAETAAAAARNRKEEHQQSVVSRRRTVAPPPQVASASQRLSARSRTATSTSSYGGRLERCMLRDEGADGVAASVAALSVVAPSSLLLLPPLVACDPLPGVSATTGTARDEVRARLESSGEGATALPSPVPHVVQVTSSMIATTIDDAENIAEEAGVGDDAVAVLLAPLAAILRPTHSVQALPSTAAAAAEDLLSRDTLNLSSMQLGDAKIAAISPALAYLIFGRRQRQSLSPRRHLHCTFISKLRCLWMANNRLGDTSLAALVSCIAADTSTDAKRLKPAPLQSLALQNNAITYKSLCTPGGGSGRHHHHRHEGTATPSDGNAACRSPVTSIAIASTTVEPEQEERSPLLILLSHLPHLEMLSLHNNSALCCYPPPPAGRGGGDGGGGGFCLDQLAMGVAHARGLRVLYLSNTSLGDAGVEAFARIALPCLTVLEKLVLSSNRISDVGVEHLSKALEAPQQDSSCSNVQASSLQPRSRGGGGVVLEELDMSKNYIGGDGVRRLRGLDVRHLTL